MTQKQKEFELIGYKCRLATENDLEAMERLAEAVRFDVGVENLRMLFRHRNGQPWEVIEDPQETIVAFASYNLLPNAIVWGHEMVVRQDLRGKGISGFFAMPEPLLGSATNDSIRNFPNHYLVLGQKVNTYYGILTDKEKLRRQAKATQSDCISFKMVTKQLAQKVSEYDRKIIGFNRTAFIKEWLLDEKRSKTLVATNEQDEVVGFGTFREYPRYWSLQPLYADSDAIAHDLYRLLSCLLEEGHYINTTMSASQRVGLDFMHQLRDCTFSDCEHHVLYHQTCMDTENGIAWSSVYSIHDFFPA